MEYLTDLKAILHSKRANIFYLEKCRIMQKDGRVLYLTNERKEKQYWNIPIANTTVILLGTGTSITQAAVRMLASAGVLIGFSGDGGTPLLAANEIEWLSPQSEYRPTEYVQQWLSFWFKDDRRLSIAKYFQISRLNFLQKIWCNDRDLQNEGFDSNESDIRTIIDASRDFFNKCRSVTDLLLFEAKTTKQLYKIAARRTATEDFTRDSSATDKANVFLNHGNYLAYGLSACTLWVLGIPHGFAVMHGKTRRGALVFDVADLVKDAVILPWAFICAKERMADQEFRQQCLLNFTKHKVLDFMFDTVKEACRLGAQS
ncbi:type I-F CRISPR-associated endonuclease Cas1f [Marispirochaeta sp.]|uniref:type I-F CRISPR-associated endonuclease Cas1f n=1 Tax=Marispirochaeta sp. TaxID=2038653 RepID=UPI0029C9884D|nr:type I-F CRISPR-associated endonuclease Cas1f [Marispirochaeta sp.]